MDPTSFASRFSTLFNKLNQKDAAAKLFPLFFLARRFCYALAIEFKQIPVLQIFILVLLANLMLIYVGMIRPFETPLLNNLELFNEIIVILCTYSMLISTDFTVSFELKQKGGWLIVFIIAANIFVNLLVMIIFSVKLLKTKIT